jgi:hypothetical protein
MREPWYKSLPLFWPVVITALGIVATGVSADTKLNETAERVDYIWTNGAPPVATRLARIDERQASMSKTLDLVQAEVHEMDERQQRGGR